MNPSPLTWKSEILLKRVAMLHDIVMNKFEEKVKEEVGKMTECVNDMVYELVEEKEMMEEHQRKSVENIEGAMRVYGNAVSELEVIESVNGDIDDVVTEMILMDNTINEDLYTATQVLNSMEEYDEQKLLEHFTIIVYKYEGFQYLEDPYLVPVLPPGKMYKALNENEYQLTEICRKSWKLLKKKGLMLYNFERKTNKYEFIIKNTDNIFMSVMEQRHLTKVSSVEGKEIENEQKIIHHDLPERYSNFYINENYYDVYPYKTINYFRMIANDDIKRIVEPITNKIKFQIDIKHKDIKSIMELCGITTSINFNTTGKNNFENITFRIQQYRERTKETGRFSDVCERDLSSPYFVPIFVAEINKYYPIGKNKLNEICEGTWSVVRKVFPNLFVNNFFVYD